MKYSKSLAICALILPVSAFTATAAIADEKEHSYSATQSESSARNADRTSVSQGLREKHGAVKSASYMSTTPENAVRVDKVIGSKLHARSDKEEVRKISDLILDESGQVIAVVVDVGGVLGMGRRSVAVSWDSIERTMNEDRDGYDFSVNATEEALSDAPAFDKDSTGIRVSRATTN